MNDSLRQFNLDKALFPTDVYHTFIGDRNSDFHLHASGSGFCSGIKAISHLFLVYTKNIENIDFEYKRQNTIICNKPVILVAERIIPTNCRLMDCALSCENIAKDININKFSSFPFENDILNEEDYYWCFEKATGGYYLRALSMKNDQSYLNIDQGGIYLGERQLLNINQKDNLISISKNINETVNYLRFTNTGGYIGSLEINYIENGECKFVVGERQYSLKSKNALVINSSVPHKYIKSENSPCSIWSMTIELKNLTTGQIAINSLIEANPCLSEFITKFDNAYVLNNGKKIFKMMIDINKEIGNKSSASYLNLLSNIVVIAIANMYYNSNSYIEDYVSSTTDYIINNYYSIKSADNIADSIGLNKIYLGRIFKRKMGISIWSYLSNIRMEKAATLLKSTSTPIGNIYQLVGINSRQNFYRLFLKHYRMSPTKYREIYRNLD